MRLSPGTKDIYVIAVDTAGNEGRSNTVRVTYDNVPFTVHLTNDIQEFGVAGADKDGALLYQFEFDVEESL